MLNTTGRGARVHFIQVAASLLSHPSPRKPTPAKSGELLLGGVNLLINQHSEVDGTHRAQMTGTRTSGGILR